MSKYNFLKIKEFVKQLIPPLLIKLIKKRHQSKKNYLSYQDAALVCQKNAYQGEDLTTVVVHKNLIYRDEIKANPSFDLTNLRILIALAGMQTSEKLNVLDFGGGGGSHYVAAKIALGLTKSIQWRVVETVAMSSQAQRLSNEELKFFSDIDGARDSVNGFDLVFTSSALQYCPEPLISLESLINLNAPYLFITRTPFVNSLDKIITIQNSRLSNNGPGPLPPCYKDRAVTYPVTYVSRTKVEELINRKYFIKYKINETGDVFDFNDASISMTGYFCIRKDS